jgi:hypothetical protein
MGLMATWNLNDGYAEVDGNGSYRSCSEGRRPNNSGQRGQETVHCSASLWQASIMKGNLKETPNTC